MLGGGGLRQRSNCNKHRAVNQANADRHKLESTGIGGVACARHGNFVPNAMVDFQKGERQMNMDYALCNAVAYNSEGLNKAINFYDINCQYSIKLQARIDQNPYLSKDRRLEIVPGIGIWHVHGHQDQCFARYAPNFIEGAGRIDGEVMETLWSSLNLISPACRGMTAAHRKESLDFQMGDSNYMKMIRMSECRCHRRPRPLTMSLAAMALTKKYNKAVKGQSESAAAFESLNESAPAASVKQWEEEARAAIDNRMESPSGMDVFEVKFHKGELLRPPPMPSPLIAPRCHSADSQGDRT
jgi:Kyakuja-Dileera-Zisupton transposase